MSGNFKRDSRINSNILKVYPLLEDSDQNLCISVRDFNDLENMVYLNKTEVRELITFLEGIVGDN